MCREGRGTFDKYSSFKFPKESLPGMEFSLYLLNIINLLKLISSGERFPGRLGNQV